MIDSFEDSYEVCNCKNITLGAIKELFLNKEINNLGELQDKTFAGTECRKCLMLEGDFGKVKKKIYCMDIIKELKMSKKFHHSHVVCTCKKVTLGEIMHAVKENGAKTIEEIGEKTDAGTCCGCCVSPEKDFGEVKMELYLTQIVDKFK